MTAIVRSLPLVALALGIASAASAQAEPLPLVNDAWNLCLVGDGRPGPEGSVALRECEGAAFHLWSLLPRGELLNVAQNKCLEAVGQGRRAREVALRSCRGTREQLWDVKLQGNRVVVRNRLEGTCLDVDARRGTSPSLRECDGDRAQSWAWRTAAPPAPVIVQPSIPPPPVVVQPSIPPAPAAAPYRSLLNASQGLCLDVGTQPGRPALRVQLSVCDGSGPQQWSLNERGELLNSRWGACLDVVGQDGRPGLDLSVSRCDGARDQQWSVEERGRVFRVRNRAQDACLDVLGFEGRSGDPAGVAECDGGLDQLWVWGPANQPVVADANRAPIHGVPLYPPPAPRLDPILETAFAQVLSAVKAATSPENKLAAFDGGLRGKTLTCAQLARALMQVALSQTKVEMVRVVAGRVVDPQNAEDVASRFSFPQDRDTVRALIASGR